MDAVQALEALHAAGQLAARPHAPLAGAPPTGARVIEAAQAYVPVGYRGERPAGVLVMLHGAGGEPGQAMSCVQPFADRLHFIAVAPKSRRATWDVIGGELGPDVAQIDRTLEAVFATYAVDPTRVAIGGFSDGASYALTIGLANGDLFRSVLALSPGFEVAPRHAGSPRVFISHGTHDQVLSIDRTSRRLVPKLRKQGVPVEYVEFDGPHTVPSDVLARALTWWLRAADQP